MPNGKRMCWRKLAQEESLASRAECRKIRADLLVDPFVSLVLLAGVPCFSRTSSVALYRSLPEHPSHRRRCILLKDVPRQDMVRGRAYTATPLVRDNMSEEHFAALSELRRRSLYSKACWQHCCPCCCPRFPLDPDVSFADYLNRYLAYS